MPIFSLASYTAIQDDCTQNISVIHDDTKIKIFSSSDDGGNKKMTFFFKDFVTAFTVGGLLRSDSFNTPQTVLPPSIVKIMRLKVADHSIAAFIWVGGLKFVQKYLGEGCLKSDRVLVDLEIEGAQGAIVLQPPHKSARMREQHEMKRGGGLESSSKSNRKALLIGMSYLKSEEPLRYSQTEMESMQKILTDYGFSKANITIMSDLGVNIENHIYPNFKNITNEVTKLVGSAEVGDILYLHVIGHGCKGLDDAAICTADYEVITDDFWSNVVKKLPIGSCLTVVVNTCYAGNFFKEASLPNKDRGDIIVFSSSGCNSVAWEGHMMNDAMFPLLRRKDMICRFIDFQSTASL